MSKASAVFWFSTAITFASSSFSPYMKISPINFVKFHPAYSAEVADIGTVNTTRAAKGFFPVVTPSFILMMIFVTFSKL